MLRLFTHIKLNYTLEQLSLTEIKCTDNKNCYAQRTLPRIVSDWLETDNASDALQALVKYIVFCKCMKVSISIRTKAK